MRVDVAVVGAGPGGATAAIRLARAGFDVALVDRARFPREKPCGEFVSPGATPILEELGLRPAIEAAGALRLDRVRIEAHGEVVELTFPADLAGSPWGWSLSRSALDAILVDAARAAGAEVFEDARVEEVRIEPSRAHVRARGTDGSTRSIEARLVIGAGGRACPVARALGIPRRHGRPRFDLLAHGAAVLSESRTCTLAIRGDRYVASAPIEGERWNVNCVVPRAALRAARDPLELYREVTETCVPPGFRPSGGVAASDVTAFRSARATADRALLVGDAALFVDPFTGQGIFLALRSAELASDTAARALRTGRCDRLALGAYDEARRSEFGPRARVSRALQAVLFRPRLCRRVVRAIAADDRLRGAIAAATADLSPSDAVGSLGFGARLATAAARIRT